MSGGVTELKRAAKLQEWSVRIAECRNSGKSVKAWCAEQGVSIQTYYRWEKRFVEKVTKELTLPVPIQAGPLMRVNPATLPSGDMGGIEISSITIRHEGSIITMPAGSKPEIVADLVKALNRYA